MTAEDVLPFPVLAVNDAKMKHLFDNRYGTGHSIVALLSNTNLFISGKAVVVMGFGWVGRGLAKYADGMGARVIVCEPDPVKLLEAYSEGYEVMNSLQAAGMGDVFLTGTGNLKVLGVEHFARMMAHFSRTPDTTTTSSISPPCARWRRAHARSGATSPNTNSPTEGGCTSWRADGWSTSPPQTGIPSRSWTSPSRCRRSRHTTSPATQPIPGIQPIPEAIDDLVARAN